MRWAYRGSDSPASVDGTEFKCTRLQSGQVGTRSGVDYDQSRKATRALRKPIERSGAFAPPCLSGAPRRFALSPSEAPTSSLAADLALQSSCPFPPVPRLCLFRWLV